MGRHPHRLSAECYLGSGGYSLTICTYQRAPYFQDGTLVDLVRQQLLQAAAAENFAILVYCFMPDHLHVVVEAQSDDANLTEFVRLAKQRAGYFARRRLGRPLWQQSYFDRSLRRAESLADVITYVVANPVRAGLVGSPIEYPYWGSAVWTREEVLEFLMDIPGKTPENISGDIPGNIPANIPGRAGS